MMNSNTGAVCSSVWLLASVGKIGKHCCFADVDEQDVSSVVCAGRIHARNRAGCSRVFCCGNGSGAHCTLRSFH